MVAAEEAERAHGKEAAEVLHSVAELYAGAKQKRGRNSLHLALTANDTAAAAHLIESGDAVLLNQPSITGCTPLMLLAMGHCDESLIWRLLERNGSVSVALRSETRRTAADYAEAKESKRSTEVVSTLRALEVEEMQRTAQFRCPVCGDVVKRRPLLAFFWERAAQGGEDNALLRRFFAEERHRPLLEARYHQVNDARQLRKELSESVAMLEALRHAQPAFGREWHVVDLCCGKSITAALVSLQYPEVRVSAVDRLEPRFLPHFNAGDGCSVQYAQLDVLHESFLAELQHLVQQASRPTALLGMHLCGKLSVRAIEAYARVPQVQTLVLSPCCLPRKGESGSPPHLYASKDTAEQYRLWAQHLEAVLRNAVPGAQVVHTVLPEVLSPRNAMLWATKALVCRFHDDVTSGIRGVGNVQTAEVASPSEAESYAVR
uniref:Methyltransferase domain-containing protein n=1 Tax=Alexandrium monilatum TaxID=311494 RepID=A0A7S4Q895_9DINO